MYKVPATPQELNSVGTSESPRLHKVVRTSLTFALSIQAWDLCALALSDLIFRATLYDPARITTGLFCRRRNLAQKDPSGRKLLSASGAKSLVCPLYSCASGSLSPRECPTFCRNFFSGTSSLCLNTSESRELTTQQSLGDSSNFQSF